MKAPESLTTPRRKTGAHKVRRSLLWLIFLVGAVAALFLLWKNSQKPLLVITGPCETTELRASFTAEGFVKGREYELAPEVSGRVVSLPFREGDSVAAGQVLLVLDSSDARAAQSQASAAVTTAGAEIGRAQAALIAQRRVHESRLRAARSRVNEAETALRRAKLGARPEEIAQAEHRLEKARVAAGLAEKAFRRAEKLYAEGALARSALESAEAAFRAAQSDVEEAKDVLSLLKSGPRAEDVAIARASVTSAQAELEVARAGSGELTVLARAVESANAARRQASATLLQSTQNLTKFTLKSPTTGVLTKVRIEPGTTILAGTPVLVVSTTQDMRIEAEISSEDAGKIKPGMALTVTSPAYPGQSFKATLQSIMPVGELKPDAAIRTRIIRARVVLNAGWRLFRPGMEVDVEGAAVLRRALTIPGDAVLIDGDQTSVFVLEGGVAKRKNIKIGFSNPDLTEVLSGLQGGQRVILTGKDQVKEGAAVSETP